MLDPSKKPKPFNFKLFNEIEWPKPTDQRDTILLSCDVFQDGVGDLVHYLEMSEFIVPKLKAQGFKVAGMVYLGDKGEPYYQQHKKRFDTLFDELHIKIDNSSLPDPKQFFDSVACEFIISAGSSNVAQNKYNDKTPRCVDIREYGKDNFGGRLEALKCANMGLPKAEQTSDQAHQEFHNYGLKFQPNQHLHKDPKQLLINIKEESFLRNLLGKQAGQINLEDTETYFKTHEFIPAYAQTPMAALLFILTMVEMNILAENSKKQDILIPGMAMDVDILKQALLDAGVTDFILVKSGKETIVGDQEKAKVRVISHFIKEDQDYEALYSLGSKITGVSGNSTLSTAIQNNSIPFILWFGGMNSASFIKSFVELSNNAQQGDEPSILCDFYDFLSYNTSSYYYPKNQPDIASGFNIPAWPTDSKEFSYPKGSEEFYKVTKELARYLNDPLLYKQWQRLQQFIVQEHNYYDHFEAVAKGGIFMSQTVELGLTNPDVNQALLQAAGLQNLLAAGVVNREELLAMPVHGLEKLAEPFVNECLLNRWLSVAEALALNKENISAVYSYYTGSLDLKSKSHLLKSPLKDWIKNNRNTLDLLTAEVLLNSQTDYSKRLIEQGVHPVVTARSFIKELIEYNQISIDNLIESGDALIQYLDQFEQLDLNQAALVLKEFPSKKSYLNHSNLIHSIRFYAPNLNPIFLTLDQIQCLDNEVVCYMLDAQLLSPEQALLLTPDILDTANQRALFVLGTNSIYESEPAQYFPLYVQNVQQMLDRSKYLETKIQEPEGMAVRAPAQDTLRTKTTTPGMKLAATLKEKLSTSEPRKPQPPPKRLRKKGGS